MPRGGAVPSLHHESTAVCATESHEPVAPAETSATSKRTQSEQDFAAAADSGDVGLVREFWEFLAHNRKWFLAPIVVALLLLSVIVILGGTAAAPFIYTLF